MKQFQLTSFSLSVLLLLLFLSISPYPLLGKKEENTANHHIAMVRLFSKEGGQSPVMLKEGNDAASLFRVDEPIDGIAVEAPSYSNNIGSLTISVFRWNGDYQTTLAAQPLASETFVNFADNSSLPVPVKLRPGTYLWLADNPGETVGLWKSPEITDRVESYLNGKPLEGGSWHFSFIVASPFPFFGTKDQYQYRLDLPAASPAEPADDSALTEKDVFPDTWEAVDELGRALPLAPETGKPKKDKQVGIFYWTWHDTARCQPNPHLGPFDNTKILTEHPEAAGDINHPSWGGFGVPHHWGEPIYGYYSTTDKWVLRKHAELLADAGVDFAVFDSTNGTLTWMDSVTALMETWTEARADGVRTPKVTFMLPFFDLKLVSISLRQLYRDIYKPGFHSDLWFYWDGKPLIYANPDAILNLIPKAADEAEKQELEEILGFFTFRAPQPSYTGGPRRPDDWGWLEVYPQNRYVGKLDGTCEMVTVGVAQNHSENPLYGKPGLHAMNDRDAFGRAHVVGQPKSADPDAFLAGGNFDQQWSRAFELDPDLVFVTGWNEWVAGRFEKWQELPNAFPDQYNEEFSRDCEPERGKLMDTFYLQLVSNIRKFKGTRSLPAPSPSKTIDLNGPWTQWNDVEPEYRDYAGGTAPRDGVGYAGVHYTNDSGRNDIVLAKVARDTANLYFYVRTAEPLTRYEGLNWMRLFIGVPDSKSPNWQGFSWMVEETKEEALLMKYTGTGKDWSWKKAATIPRAASGKRLALAVPRSALELGSGKVNIHFKWSDNMLTDGDILDFYINGDTAPDGRFVYRYKE